MGQYLGVLIAGLQQYPFHHPTSVTTIWAQSWREELRFGMDEQEMGEKIGKYLWDTTSQIEGATFGCFVW